MEKNKDFPLKGLYHAKNVVAKVRYSYSKKDEDCGFLPAEKLETPFAIEFLHSDKHLELWDLNAFRPDFRSYENILKQLSSENGVEMIVLYQNVKYTDKKVMIPRYVIAKGVRFVNVR